MNKIKNLKQFFMFKIASALQYNTRKVFFKFEVLIEEKILTKLRKRFEINGRFKRMKQLENYLIKTKECDYGTTQFVDKIFFRVQNSTTKKINNHFYKSCPKLVVRFMRDYRIK